MPGSDDRQIYRRSNVLWFPPGHIDTTTGDSTVNIETNALNSAAACLQRSIEALNQRWEDIGIDFTLSGYVDLKHPYIGMAGKEALFNNYCDPIPFIWGTKASLSGGNLPDQSPTDDNYVGRVGINASLTKPFRCVINGRPCIQKTPIYITTVETTNLFEIDNDNGAIKKVAANTGTSFLCYVTAKESFEEIRLIARFSVTSFTDEEIDSIIPSDERLLFIIPWDTITYNNTFFWDNVHSGSQNTSQDQFIFSSVVDWSHRYRLNPHMLLPKGSVIPWRPHSWEEFDILFSNIGSNHYAGDRHKVWEGWCVMDGFQSIPNMENKFPKGHHIGTYPDSGGGTGEGALLASKEYPADGKESSDMLDSGENDHWDSVASGSATNAATDQHTHKYSPMPPYETFVYLIKT